MHAICESCCRADLLKSLVVSSALKGQCSVCGQAGQTVLETNARDFLLAVKALIRYHFSEWQYHSKLGGDSFERLLSSDNPLINLNPQLNELNYEDFLMSFLDDIDSDQQITLFTAYGRDIYGYEFRRAVSEGNCPLIAAVRSDLEKANHFLVEAKYEAEFAAIKNHISINVEADSVWHRARIGATRQAADASFEMTGDSYYYEPHTDQAIGAPPVGTTSAGRLNRTGISFLYLASDEDTAVAEVRPHPGVFVSLGSFVISKTLSIADLSRHSLADLFRTNEDLEKLETIVAIENAIATPAPPTHQQLYSLTQFLSDVLRKLGFDGVKFRSTVGPGVNLVLFDPGAATWRPSLGRVVEVKRVIYEHEDRKVFDPGQCYEIDFTPRDRETRHKLKPPSWVDEPLRF